jgi:MFS family permease
MRPNEPSTAASGASGGPGQHTRLPPGLAPLRSRDYTLYLLGNGGSSVGGQAEIVANPWLLYQLTASPFLLGLNGFFLALPIFLMVPVAGAIADRVSARRLLIVVQSLGLLNSAALGALVATGLIQPWHIWVQGLISGTLGAFDVTARQALFPRLIPRADLDQAVSLNFTVVRVAMFSGPTIGGLLLAGVGSAIPYFFNAGTFLLMLGAMLAIHEPAEDAAARKRGTVAGDVFAGLGFMRRSEVISAIMIFAALWGILSHNPTILTIFAKDVLEVGPEGLGLLLSAVAVGQLAGSIGLIAMGDVRRKGVLLLGMGALYCVSVLVFAFSPWFVLSAVVLALSGIAIAVFSATRHVLLQHSSPDDMRGRIMGAHLMVTRGMSPLSQTVSGALVALLGPLVGLLAMTLALAAVTVGVAVRSPQLRTFTSNGGH